MIGQWEHQSILRRHIEVLGGRVELDTAFVSLQQGGDCVTVELSKNINGQEATQKAKFAYVIGTDGAQYIYSRTSIGFPYFSLGSVRKALSIEFVGETREGRHLQCRCSPRRFGRRRCG